MKGLGVDYVRVTVLWSLAAENVRSTRARRKRFRAARPVDLPPPQLGSLRRPRPGGQARRHRRLLQRDRPGPGLRARKGPPQPAAQPAHVAPEGARVLQVRGSGGHALLRLLCRREPGPAGAAARVLLVAVERAEPGRLADPAVLVQPQAEAPDPRLAAHLPEPVPLRPSRAGSHRARRGRHPRGRDGPARDPQDGLSHAHTAEEVHARDVLRQEVAAPRSRAARPRREGARTSPAGRRFAPPRGRTTRTRRTSRRTSATRAPTP